MSIPLSPPSPDGHISDEEAQGRPNTPMRATISQQQRAIWGLVFTMLSHVGAGCQSQETKPAPQIQKPLVTNPEKTEQELEEAKMAEQKRLLEAAFTSFSKQSYSELLKLFGEDTWRAYDLSKEGTLTEVPEQNSAYFSQAVNKLEASDIKRIIQKLKEMKNGELRFGAQGIVWRLTRADYERPFNEAIAVFLKYLEELRTYAEEVRKAKEKLEILKMERGIMAHAPIDAQERHAEAENLLTEKLEAPFQFSDPKPLEEMISFFMRNLRERFTSFPAPEEMGIRLLTAPQYSGEFDGDMTAYVKTMSVGCSVLFLKKLRIDGLNILSLEGYMNGKRLFNAEKSRED